ncbi:hypothetical protein Gotur_005855 [Gossypium turneri]
MAICKIEHIRVEWVELCTLMEGIKLAHTKNLERVIFKSDSTSIVNRVRKSKEGIIIIGHRVKETISMLDFFSEFEVKWIRRSKNKVANHLCKLALAKNCNLLFEMDYPSEIHKYVIYDSS